MASEVEQRIRDTARKILESGEAGVVVGYGAGSTPDKVMPVFITNPADVEKLVWNDRCYNNLSLYLTKPLVRKFGKVAMIGKGCDIRAAIVLWQESQFPREKTIVIGVDCGGVAPIAGKPDDFRAKCATCDVKRPPVCDHLVENPAVDVKPATTAEAKDDGLDSKSPAEKRAYWFNQFSRCIKCYACRGVCPLCYCDRCIVEKNRPQWILTSPHDLGNFEWNLVRAFHLAGRCVQCGECTRVCPSDIPLAALNRKLAGVVRESFDYEAGRSHETEPSFLSFKEDDAEEFIR
ncbi:MAG TPA: 4Fe-4S dicluster domain-containing protein [Candidatus Brocadiia bacterium]|nr:4Fe-4S dicluster domain-containing protein [Candidatus Brocadiia bacterium]